MTATPFRRGFGTAASPAASPLPQYSEDSPLPFYASSAYTDGVGVFCTGPDQFDVIVRIRGQLARVPGFSSIATATEAFRRMQNGMSRSPVAGAPELSRAPKPAPAPVPELKPAHVPAPEPACAHGAPPVKHYKGVYPQANGTFTAAFTHNGKLKGLGTFPTPALAASAYDDAVRSIGGKAVNTPRCPGEIQAVPRHRKNAAANKPTPAGAVPDAQPNKRKRGRPRKVIREDGAAVPASPAAAAAAMPSQLAAAAAQFRGVTAISGGSGFFAWLSFCNADGSLIRKMLGAFGTAEEAALAVDIAARRHSQLEQLNFPTTEELARMGRQTRSTHRQAGRYVERKMPEVAESEDEDVDPAPRGMPRRRMQSPAQARRDAVAPGALAQAVSPPPEAPEAPEEPDAPAPPPAQSPPVTPDPLALLALEAPAPEAPPPPQYQPNEDVIAFLRSISPPLRCLAAAVAAAPGSGVSMRQLHQLALLRNSALLAAYFDNVAASLNINGTCDRLDLMAALDRLGP